MSDIKRPSDILVTPHEVSDTMLKEAELNLKRGYVDYDMENYMFSEDDVREKIKIRIIHPDQETDLFITESYAEKFNQLLMTEIKTWDELKETLMKRGVWTDQDEETFNKGDEMVRDAAYQAAKKIYDSKLDKKKLTKEEKKIVDKARKIYDDVVAKVDKVAMKRYKYYVHTVEGLATQHAHNMKFIYCVLYEKDGEYIRLWDSLEAFKKEKSYNKGFISDLFAKAINFWSGLSQEILQYLPNYDIVGEEAKNVST